ncbi:MAG: helix-turn-helix transcriptional regulator [Myxococcota bacterium]
MNPEALSRNLSQNLRRIRAERGLTQVGLSTLSEVPRPTIAKLEGGSPNPTLHVLAQIAAALRVGIDELLAPTPSVGRLYRAEDLVLRVERGVERRQLVPHPIPICTTGCQPPDVRGGPGPLEAFWKTGETGNIDDESL